MSLWHEEGHPYRGSIKGEGFGCLELCIDGIGDQTNIRDSLQYHDGKTWKEDCNEDILAHLILGVTFHVYFNKILGIVRNSLKTFVSQVKQFPTI